MNKTALVLAVCIVSWLAFTAVSALLAAGYAYIEAQDRFTEESSLTAQAINARLHDVNVTTEIAGLSLRSGTPERDDFRVLAESILVRYAYVHALAYFPRVRPAERPAFEQRRRDEGFAGFRIHAWRNGHTLPPQAGRSYYPLLMVEPFTPATARLLGRDAATVPCLAGAIDDALAQAQVHLLDDCRLPDAKPGPWLLRPLYSGRALALEPDTRAVRGQGVVALQLSPTSLLADIRVPAGLHYRVAGPGGAQWFAQGGVDGRATVPTLEREVSLPLGDTLLTVHFERPIPPRELLQFGAGLSATIGLVAALLAGLLSANLWERRRAQAALQRHRDHLEEEVAARTRALSEANATLQVEIAERRRAERELAQLAIRDPLTGLYNRREMERRLDEEIERCRRYHHPLAVLMLDVDHFKRLNDSFGHQVGDEVLRGIAARIERAVRRADFVARYGGEEFLAILPDTSQEHAADLAERIRGDIADYTAAVVNGEPVRVTASLGIAVFPPDGGDRTSLCRNADVALYQAKAGGRNRVQSYRATGAGVH